MRQPDPAELAHEDETLVYRYDMNEWFSDYPFNYFCFAYRNRIDKIQSLCQRYLKPGDRILDIGCAQGNLAIMLAEQGFDVTACDINAHFIAYAKRKLSTESALTFLCGNAFEVLPQTPSFQLVIATEIMEHVAYPEELLFKIYDLLVPGGYCILTTPNGGYFKNTLPSYTDISRLADRAELEARQFQPEGDDHLFLFHASELAEIVSDSQFTLVSLDTINSVLPSLLHRVLGEHRSSAVPYAFFGLDRLLGTVPRFRERFTNSLVVCLQKPG